MSAKAILQQTALVRTIYGVASLAAPNVVAGAARMGDLDPDTRYTNALFGGRDLTVAAATMSALRRGDERQALWINATCEATDLAALALEVKRRGAGDAAVRVGIVFNLFGWLTVLRAARALR